MQNNDGSGLSQCSFYHDTLLDSSRTKWDYCLNFKVKDTDRSSILICHDHDFILRDIKLRQGGSAMRNLNSKYESCQGKILSFYCYGLLNIKINNKIIYLMRRMWALSVHHHARSCNVCMNYIDRRYCCVTTTWI